MPKINSWITAHNYLMASNNKAKQAYNEPLLSLICSQAMGLCDYSIARHQCQLSIKKLIQNSSNILLLMKLHFSYHD